MVFEMNEKKEKWFFRVCTKLSNKILNAFICTLNEVSSRSKIMRLNLIFVKAILRGLMSNHTRFSYFEMFRESKLGY